MKSPKLSNLSNLANAPARIRVAAKPSPQSALSRTSLYLTPELHRALRMRVIDERRDMSAIIRDAVEAYLKSGSGLSS